MTTDVRFLKGRFKHYRWFTLETRPGEWFYARCSGRSDGLGIGLTVAGALWGYVYIDVKLLFLDLHVFVGRSLDAWDD